MVWNVWENFGRIVWRVFEKIEKSRKMAIRNDFDVIAHIGLLYDVERL